MTHEHRTASRHVWKPRRRPVDPSPDKPGTYMGMPKFSKAVKGELNLSVQRKNMRNATTTIRNKRAMRVSESPDWQDLRDAAESIKNRVGRHLDHYLVEAEKT